MRIRRSLATLAAAAAVLTTAGPAWATSGPTPPTSASSAGSSATGVPEALDTPKAQATPSATTPPSSAEASPAPEATPTPTTSAIPDPSTAEPDSDSALDLARKLEKFWTPERMAQAKPVEEQQAREAAAMDRAKKDGKTEEAAPRREDMLRSPSHTFKGIKEVGTFYWAQKAGNDYPDRYDYRFCGGTVVPSPRKNLVASAAHCFDSNDQKENLIFVPQHSAKAPMPHGMYPIKKGAIVKDPGYTGSKKSEENFTDVDVAFLATEPRSDGKKVENVVGSIPMGFSTGFSHTVHAIGYPYLYGGGNYKPKQDPLSCTTPAKKYTTGTAKDSGGRLWRGGTFTEIHCDGYVGGTSGGPFITAGSESPKLIGVTGGWMTGGHSANTSYSSYFDNEVKRIYEAAKAGKQPASINPPPMTDPVLPGAGTWKHAKAIANGYVALNGPVSEDRTDMFVMWSDAELSIYRGAGKGKNYFDKEFKVQGPNELWRNHAKQVVAGDFTGDNGSDLIVRWSDGEVTLYPSVDEKGFHGEYQLATPNGTWKHAEAMTAGRFGGNKWQDDLVVRWSDGEVTVYQNTGDNKKLGKEIKVVSPAGTWKHAIQITAGDYAGDDTWDLIVRWSDGELTHYQDFTGTGSSWREHKWRAPNDLWKHALLVSGGDFTDNPWADDTIVRWSDGELTLYADGNASGIGTEHRLVAPA
ncbi:trypsin-like serine protease [Streptomyces sp. H27-D2]|uniref:trypsin-like serine protease n=1 Tax=Streptomyces sp. H27-D2 TaxID=3046304 RepID=UPI002DBADE1E|nr:trypsin-like serine protease [Streptomyces sp. H27-D2]MEC4019691.1 trypsin-like serine protease [Streptomyces sp. H27-D2]